MAALFAAPQAAMAWKPFTHNFIGDQAYTEATKNYAATGKGYAVVGANKYPISPSLAAALYHHRASYNAGVVGPDGFPDLAFGQSQIHPNHTGKWLSYLVQQAQAAQTATVPGAKHGTVVAKYTDSEKGQILAFTYGFLTHAAGDMWGHTLINDFAKGLFPSFGEFTQRSKAEIALRHIVAESYVGSATPGWDRAQGKRRKICRPGQTTHCDVSDDTTHPVSFSAPTKFIYDTFVDPYQPLPVGTCTATKDAGCPGGVFNVKDPKPHRGPLLDFFLNLEGDLQRELAIRSSNARYHVCSTLDPDCNSTPYAVHVSTVRGKTTLLLTKRTCDAKVFCLPDLSRGKDEARAEYLRKWIHDIRDGLKSWGTFSLGITKALFDPQARRDAQNDACHSYGTEDDDVRAECESKIGALDTIDFETAYYVNHHLFSMLGAPDVVGEAREDLNALADEIDDWIGPALNLVRLAANKVRTVIHTLLKEKIREATGLDVDEIRGFITHPERWMCGTGVRTRGSDGVVRLEPQITLPGAGSFSPASLFKPADHLRLDAIMGLPADHHQRPGKGSSVPQPCQAIEENTPFSVGSFAAMQDSITQANLLLLDGTQLNLALGDVLTRAGIIQNRTLVHTYPADGNVMYTPLQPASAPWLDLIDGDHAWRADGLPRFCAPVCTQLPGLTNYPLQPITQSGTEVSAGGTGRYPPWESCVLRPAFRILFKDWENDANVQPNFPDLGDPTSPDPATDPNPPAITITPRGVTTTVSGVRTVLPGASFQPIGHDDVFNESQVKVSYRIYASGTAPGSFQPVGNRGSFSLPSGALTGKWVVEVRAEDPCGSSAKAETFSVV